MSEQGQAVIGSAAGQDGVLFWKAQSRQCLAGVEEPRFRALEGLDVLCGQVGDAGQVAQKVHDDALGLEQLLGRSLERGDHGSFRDLVSVVHVEVRLAFGAAEFEDHRDEGQPRDHGVLLGDDHGLGHVALSEEAHGGEVGNRPRQGRFG